MIYYVYILSSNNNQAIYVGVTNDLIRRVYEHKQKFVDGFSKKYNTTKLVYFEKFTSVEFAIEREKQLKKFCRAKKENLINSKNKEWKDLYEGLI